MLNIRKNGAQLTVCFAFACMGDMIICMAK